MRKDTIRRALIALAFLPGAALGIFSYWRAAETRRMLAAGEASYDRIVVGTSEDTVQEMLKAPGTPTQKANWPHRVFELPNFPARMPLRFQLESGEEVTLDWDVPRDAELSWKTWAVPGGWLAVAFIPSGTGSTAAVFKIKSGF